MEHDFFELQVVSMSAASAKRFAGRSDEPTDLGPANPERYRDGARVFGFRPQPDTRCVCDTCRARRGN